MRRLPWFLLAVATLSEPGLKASYCFWHSWTLSEIEHAPVLLAGHVVSLERKNGPHFTGDPRHSAPGQEMIADVEVLRFIEQGGAGQMPAGGRLKIRFIGRDGPDFGFCPEPLPDLEPGQTLLVALRGNPHAPNEPWSLLGANGMGLATRVATKMEEPARGDNDAHSFIVREFVNSFRSDDPIARFTAASLFAQQGDSLEPELSDWLKRSVGNSTADWARILGSILISYPGRPLTMDEVEIGRLPQPPPRFNPLPLAQLARSQLPDRPAAERLIWQSLLADLPRLADEPYHPLFSYQPSYPLLSAVRYLTPYAGTLRSRGW